MQLTGQDAFVECVADVVMQKLGDASELIHKTSHAGIRCADHRAPIFNAAKDRVGDMLA